MFCWDWTPCCRWLHAHHTLDQALSWSSRTWSSRCCVLCQDNQSTFLQKKWSQINQQLAAWFVTLGHLEENQAWSQLPTLFHHRPNQHEWTFCWTLSHRRNGPQLFYQTSARQALLQVPSTCQMPAGVTLPCSWTLCIAGVCWKRCVFAVHESTCKTTSIQQAHPWFKPCLPRLRALVHQFSFQSCSLLLQLIFTMILSLLFNTLVCQWGLDFHRQRLICSNLTSDSSFADLLWCTQCGFSCWSRSRHSQSHQHHHHQC
jgi:hypothetical protein